MSQAPTFPSSSSSAPASVLASGSALEAEKHARVAGEGEASSSSPRAPKPRSCVTCRTRKVRCDKKSPCSNCRRANISCVLPSTDRQPRWARRLQQGPSGDVMNRLRSLENLVKHLSSQLDEAHAAASASAGGSPGVNFSGSGSGHEADANNRIGSLSAKPGKMDTQFGRLVVEDPNRSHYVGSGFWSRVNDELNDLKMDTQHLALEGNESSDDEESFGQTPSTQELERSPLERNSFFFRHNLNPAAPDLREFHPLPSQIPFILDIFSENVNSVTQCVYMPAVTKMIRELRGDTTRLTAVNEALLFSIYYAAITSMENDDIVINFGCTKQELNLKYRLGLEHALAKADFLNVPDLTLVQAFVNFLALLRRHDSPRFVWMMTGLAIRMAISLGLHRDGSKFANLSPYDVEMRRRVWWSICMLDVRTSEDQGTEFTITEGSFDTKIPSNINNADIGPDIQEMAPEREGLTDMSFPRMSAQTVMIVREMMAKNAQSPSIEEQSRLLHEIYQSTEEIYLKHATESSIAYWVSVTIARLVTAKMTLFVYLPHLFSSPSEQLTSEIRAKLLVCAIEIAEYNHALNSEQACRHWRWVYQTYTHWHAIVYILIEICRVPWSPVVERAWIALHSAWLIPPQSHMNQNTQFCFPLKRLMSKAQTHRRSETVRLRGDPQAVASLEEEYEKIQLPASPELASNGAISSLERWRQLVTDHGDETYGKKDDIVDIGNKSFMHTGLGSTSASGFQSLHATASSNSSTLNPADVGPVGFGSAIQSDSFPQGSGNIMQQAAGIFQEVPTYQPNGEPIGPGIVPWLWDEEIPSDPNVLSTDINMEIDDIDWYGWVDSAKGMQWDGGPSSSL
ncbi:hypothetical protein N7509_004566 [Penicillium cosmopolitanum]|uniref:Zn(2)-C6 fungal-type domain-containing protein n=1 Tax=Penicillium cosmopolitanum TaxID=1131564 RepID=A0A9X0B974_9EURO|nr:uncharacterized protein N7509_004566 [Penicillium cosmopolitanum]KAJ5396453.1 hypothetical protein N7509_004566 [Penicillium cosmopolitanum]